MLLGLVGYSGSALAIANGGQESVTFWIGLLFSAGLLLVSGYVKGVRDDQKDLEKDVAALKELMLRDYHPKDEIHQMFSRIDRWMEKIDKRLEGDD